MARLTKATSSSTGVRGRTPNRVRWPAHREFAAAGDQPFFAVIFTTTHHAPFDIPEGKVPAATGEDGRRATAVRYADFALGRFLDQARASDYWDDTLFYVTADHNSRVYGNQLVPVPRFHIPGVIVGGPVEARRIPGITSQIDMLPTLLSLIGVDGFHPSIGRDLTRPEFRNGSGRAMMQFNRLQAYLENDRVVVLSPDGAPHFFRLEADGCSTRPKTTSSRAGRWPMPLGAR